MAILPWAPATVATAPSASAANVGINLRSMLSLLGFGESESGAEDSKGGAGQALRRICRKQQPSPPTFQVSDSSAKPACSKVPLSTKPAIRHKVSIRLGDNWASSQASL